MRDSTDAAKYEDAAAAVVAARRRRYIIKLRRLGEGTPASRLHYEDLDAGDDSDKECVGGGNTIRLIRIHGYLLSPELVQSPMANEQDKRYVLLFYRDWRCEVSERFTLLFFCVPLRAFLIRAGVYYYSFRH